MFTFRWWIWLRAVRDAQLDAGRGHERRRLRQHLEHYKGGNAGTVPLRRWSISLTISREYKVVHGKELMFKVYLMFCRLVVLLPS